MDLSALHHKTIILMDAEFTCWEGSLASRWSDPQRPAELIEIGMIAYDPIEKTDRERYSSLVRPSLNPELSQYCLDIIPVSQIEVDGAPEFHDAIDEISRWLAEIGDQEIPTCAWGDIDRSLIAEQALRSGESDPFGPGQDIRFDDLVKSSLGISSNVKISREDVRGQLGVDEVAGRHRALADAADLIELDRALGRLGPAPP